MPEFEKVLDLPRVRGLPRRTMRASALRGVMGLIINLCRSL